MILKLNVSCIASSQLFLQVLPLSPFSLVLNSPKMAVELWMSLWAGHWVVETVLISTSSEFLPMLPRPHMEDFWTLPLLVSHNMNWLVSWWAMSTTSQCMVSTVEVRMGVRVSPWQSDLKGCTNWTLGSVFNLWTMLTVLSVWNENFFEFDAVRWLLRLFLGPELLIFALVLAYC